MINTHAIIDADHWVDRLTNQPDNVELEEGFTLVELSESVRCWPQGRGRLHCTDEGVLSFVDQRSLGEVKLEQWVLIKEARAIAINADLDTPYGVFQCSTEDRQNITDAIMLAQTLTALQQTVSIPWTLADNTVVTLNTAHLVTVGLLLGQRVQEAHATARTLRSQIEAATTVGDVEAIVWTG